MSDSAEKQLLFGADLSARKKDIQRLGTKQLLHIWEKEKTRKNDPFLWGDEVECLLVHLDEKTKQVHPTEPPWDNLESLKDHLDEDTPSFQPEFGSHMLETTPAKPFGGDLKDLLCWEDDLRRRRKLVNDALPQSSYLITLPYLPHFGAVPHKQTTNHEDDRHEKTQSHYVADNSMTKNVRITTVVRNLHHNKGGKFHATVPIFRDKNTPWPWRDPTASEEDLVNAGEDDATLNRIYMDTVAFGATGCSLQVTMQAPDQEAGRRLYDNLIPLAPILLALTAGTPIFRGFLSDVDTRWSAFVQAVDDRTVEQVKGQVRGHTRSRVSTSTDYIALNARPEYQLPNLEFDNDVKQELIHGGMDEVLATHFAHIFSRDPLFASTEDLDEADATDSTVADSMVSNVYQLVRFKPPQDGKTGWLIEFRPMEAGITDFENTAFAIFTVLAAQTILHSPNLDLCIPLEKVDTNMIAASNINAATEEKFWFRSDLTGCNSTSESNIAQFTTDEIMNGHQDDSDDASGKTLRGIIPLIRDFVSNDSRFDDSTRSDLYRYLDFVADRAAGKQDTNARWIRRLVSDHPDYRHDSVVPESVVYDIIARCVDKST